MFTIDKLVEKAKYCGVAFSLTFEEVSDKWFVEIMSAAPLECWVGKSTTFELAIEDSLRWLEGLSNEK